MDILREREINEIIEQACIRYKHPIPNWTINNRLITTFGRAWYNRNFIEFNKIVETIDRKRLENLVKHEVAHLVTKEGHNGEYFKSVCARLGADASATTREFDKEVIVNSKYIIRCRECDAVVAMYQRKCKSLSMFQMFEKGVNPAFSCECGSNRFEVIQNIK